MVLLHDDVFNKYQDVLAQRGCVKKTLNHFARYFIQV